MEMIVDFIVLCDDVCVVNVCCILFGDGFWVGNFIGNSV